MANKPSHVKIAELSIKYPTLDFTKSVYTDCHSVLTAICPKHGEVTKTGKHWNVNGCPKCGLESCHSKEIDRASGFRAYNDEKNKDTIKRWEQYIKDNSHRFEFISAEIAKKSDKVVVRCLEHGNVFTPQVSNLLNGTGCPICGRVSTGLALRSKTSKFKVDAKKVHGEKYSYENTNYTTSSKKVEIVCPRHGVFYTTPHNHLQGYGCTRCTGQMSRPEEEVYIFVKKFVSVERHVRSIIPPKELDIWIPHLKIGIEFNGSYWHSDRWLDRKSHFRKWEQMTAKGYRLVQVFDDEWLHNRPAVENRLKMLIGVAEKHDARKCRGQKLTWSVASTFLNEYHTQGAGPHGSHYYGLYNGDLLVSVMTFGKARKGGFLPTEKGYELLRFASNGSVRGGASKLWSMFLKETNPEQVISYCDLRYGTGGVYEKLGFKLTGLTEPDYWWVSPNGKKTSRYTVQKHRLKDVSALRHVYTEGMTENEACSTAGWFKVYGVGHQRWEWKAP